MNLFLMLSALGLSHSLFGERLLPVGTLYDPVHLPRPRCAELRLLPGRALHRRRHAVGHHAGAGGRRAPVDRHAADRHGAGRACHLRAGLRRRAGRDHGVGLRLYATRGPGGRRGSAGIRDEKGGSVYLRLSTRPLDQLATADDARAAPGHHRRRLLAAPAEPGSELAIVYTGAVAPEAIEAAGLLARGPARRRRAGGDVGRSPVGRLARGPARRASRATARRARTSRRLLAALPRDAAIVTVTDAYPEALSWLGGVCGHRVRALGVEHFGQSGSLAELYGHYGLDVNAILDGRRGHQRAAGAVSVLAEVEGGPTLASDASADEIGWRRGSDPYEQMPRNCGSTAKVLWHHVAEPSDRPRAHLRRYDTRTLSDELRDACSRMSIEVHAYCIASNHYHLLVHA